MADWNPLANDLFLRAVEIAPPEERRAFLDERCGGDAALRQEIESLLAAHAEAGSFLDKLAEHPSVIQQATGNQPNAEASGTVIAGRYKLLEQLGEGGMGMVWVAEQTQPVRRKVALKVIKPGMDSRTVLARFEQERHALALMDHPNIAKVLDAGVTGAEAQGLASVGVGRPFFVMEYVKGVPLTQYCDGAQLTVRERLELFLPVCQAVQHAHQKGIIHRDLKPSNVLVCLYDGKPVPKVIDFGLAKAMHQQLTEHSLYTAHGVMVGTPLYMSPEQAEFNNLDIDTRADIYSLGVILYELLTGTTPLEKARFAQVAWQEIIRLIREEEPPNPSTRLSGSGSLPSVAAQRKTEPAKLSRLLRGELDWIVMKALEKERSRRYETASGFARDIQRHLADEPVEAKPASVGYRLRKFMRRNKGPVMAAGVVIAALVTGMIGTTWQWQRAIRERDDKEIARQGEEKERKRAQEAEADTKAFGDFLTERVLASARPKDVEGGLGVDVTVARALEEAEKRIAQDFAGRPRAEATARQALGVTWRNLTGDRFPRAEDHLRRAVELRARELGPEHPDTLVSWNSLGLLLREMGRYQDAIDVLEHVRDVRTTTFGPDHLSTLATLSDLAVVYQSSGRRADATRLLEQVRDQQIKQIGADHLDTVSSLHNLAGEYQFAGRHDDAIQLYEQVRDRRIEKLGREHPLTLMTLNNLAGAYHNAGRLVDAIPLYEQVRNQLIIEPGPDHPRTLVVHSNLAAAYQAVGRFNEAIPLLEKVSDQHIRKHGADHPDTLTMLHNLASSYEVAGRFADAIALFEQVRDQRIKKIGDDHPHTLTTMAALAATHHKAGRLTDAIEQFEKVARCIEKRNYQHQYAGPILSNTIGCYEALKQFEKAEAWRRKWMATVKATDGAESAKYAAEMAGLGLNLLKQKKYSDAEPVLREALAIREKKEPEIWATFNTKSLLGGSLLGQKKCADAEPLLVAGYEGMKQRAEKIPPPAKVRVTESLERLVELYDVWGKPDEAANWRVELEERKDAAEKPPSKP